MQVRSRVRPRGRPFVTLAYAQSVDGSIAVSRGRRSAISGPDSLRFTHRLRACHDAILVGVGTVVADDPELRVRWPDPRGEADGARNPQPVIVDSRLATPTVAKLLRRTDRRPWIGTTIAGSDEDEAGADRERGGSEERHDGNGHGAVHRRGNGAGAAANDHLDDSVGATIDSARRRPGDGGARGNGNGLAAQDLAARRASIEAAGCRLLRCPPWPNGWVDLHALLARLEGEGIRHVMVEGGARIITSFLDAQLVDYAIVTIAPIFLGGLAAVGPPGERGGGSRAQPSQLRRWTSGRLGDDLVFCGEVACPPR